MSAKLAGYFFVTLPIPRNFGCPKSEIDLWQGATATIMTVPKTTMDEDAPFLA